MIDPLNLPPVALPVRAVRAPQYPIPLPPGLTGLVLRAETPDDLPALRDYYAAARAAEMLAAPPHWDDAAKRAFLDQQFDYQYLHYTRHYAEADFMVLCRGGAPVGRLYLHWGAGPAGEVRIVDVTLAPAVQGQGIGAALLAAVQAAAHGQGRAVTIHVEIGNPARRLYERLGFVAETGRLGGPQAYILMRSAAGVPGLVGIR